MEVSHASIQPLSDDALVMLDPAVEVLESEVDGFSLLCHTALEIGMAVPPGEGLLDFVRSLTGGPVRVGTLREEYDDRALIDEMLSSLLGRGFAHLMPRKPRPTAPMRRRALDIDLDAVVSLESLCALWSAGGTAPDVRLRCLRLSDHKTTLKDLAQRRAAGTLRAHHVVVRAPDGRCDPDVHKSLVKLGTAVEIDGVEWPAPRGPVAGLAEMTRALIPAHIIVAPDASILDEEIRARCVAWCRREFVSGLCLRLDAASIREEDYADLLNAVGTLESALGDVVVTNMPSDEVLLGNTDRGWLSEETCDRERRLRLAYLRWRIPLIKSFEGDCPWSQIPELEDYWVRSTDDLLPNRPELLLLAPGSSLVDVCGGMGRVARRLAPAVGQEGIVVSIEMRRFLTERARHFANEGGFTNIQFRPGLAERLPLPDQSVDAAVNEWTGAIWELGLGPTMVKEMARVVRPGGRIAVTHRLVQLRLDALDQPWVQYEQIYRWMRDAFRIPELTIIAERVWGQTVPSTGGQNASLWLEQYMPRLVNPNDRIFSFEDSDQGAGRADVYLTTIAERRRC
jgi:ubiquinone/menaquinone biosynthesis C-methylase UbiE